MRKMLRCMVIAAGFLAAGVFCHAYPVGRSLPLDKLQKERKLGSNMFKFIKTVGFMDKLSQMLVSVGVVAINVQIWPKYQVLVTLMGLNVALFSMLLMGGN